MRILLWSSHPGSPQSLKSVDDKPGPLLQRIPRDIVKSLKKVNWIKVWRIKKVGREETMTESLHQLVREFEEKLTIIFLQMVKEAEDLKNEVKDLNRSCDTLRAEKTTLKAEILKLKNGILHSIETMRDSLSTIVEEADEAAAEGKEADEEVA
jgi:cell division protein FtsB